MSGSRGRRISSITPPLLAVARVAAASIFLQVIPGFCEDSPASKNEVNSKHPSSSSRKKGLAVLFICLGVAAFILLSVFLLKMWQKKRREEQYARLLKLFEEDDELEVELGLRD